MKYECCDTKSVRKNNWQEYVSLLKLEITCGEAPFTVIAPSELLLNRPEEKLRTSQCFP